MFAIGIRYLCGWAMATHPSDRKRPEWPPHPDRVFQALAAAHFETDGGPDEYQALRLLSALPPPEVSASPHHERTPVTSFVPVNGDKADQVSKDGPPLFPHADAIRRSRQPRTFPVAIPERDVVYLTWPDAEFSPEQREALGRLCRKVAAVGHSASLVQMWAEENPPEPDYVPKKNPGAPLRMRVPHAGRLDDLPNPNDSELRPPTSGWHGYGPPATARNDRQVPGTVFSPDLLVLRRVDGLPLGLESTLPLTETLRQTVIRHCPEPVPEWVSGHRGPDGPPSIYPHMAFLPLAHVGREFADGRLLGLALAIPSEGISPDDQRQALEHLLFDEIGRIKDFPLYKADLFEWQVTLDDRETRSRPVALRPETWTAIDSHQPADCWATVTPIVLDRYPKASGDAEATIRRACGNIGLPEPESVEITPSPWFIGVPHARRFPPMIHHVTGGKRYHIHARIRFSEPVRGPVILGAGRYRGYGLCRPWRGEDS